MTGPPPPGMMTSNLSDDLSFLEQPKEPVAAPGGTGVDGEQSDRFDVYDLFLEAPEILPQAKEFSVIEGGHRVIVTDISMMIIIRSSYLYKVSYTSYHMRPLYMHTCLSLLSCIWKGEKGVLKA